MLLIAVEDIVIHDTRRGTQVPLCVCASGTADTWQPSVWRCASTIFDRILTRLIDLQQMHHSISQMFWLADKKPAASLCWPNSIANR